MESKTIGLYKSKYKKVGVLILKSNVLNVGPSSERLRLYYSYRQYTNLFIFRFISLLSLCSTLRLSDYMYIKMNFLISLTETEEYPRGEIERQKG